LAEEKSEKKKGEETEGKTTMEPETERKICQMYEEAGREYAESSKTSSEVLWNIRRGNAPDYKKYNVISMLNSSPYLTTSKWFERWKGFLESKQLEQWAKEKLRVYETAEVLSESVPKFDAVFSQLAIEEGVLSGWDDPKRKEMAKKDAETMKTEPIVVLRRVVLTLKNLGRDRSIG